jgi:hypothetical protein
MSRLSEELERLRTEYQDKTSTGQLMAAMMVQSKAAQLLTANWRTIVHALRRFEAPLSEPEPEFEEIPF